MPNYYVGGDIYNFRKPNPDAHCYEDTHVDHNTLNYRRAQ